MECRNPKIMSEILAEQSNSPDCLQPCSTAENNQNIINHTNKPLGRFRDVSIVMYIVV